MALDLGRRALDAQELGRIAEGPAIVEIDLEHPLLLLKADLDRPMLGAELLARPQDVRIAGESIAAARPVTRPSPGNCSAVATAPTALTPPASAASTKAPARALTCDPLAIRENMVIGSSMLAMLRAASTGLRPTLSDNAPMKGVTRITTTAATVDRVSDAFSLNEPAEVRKAGT